MTWSFAALALGVAWFLHYWRIQSWADETGWGTIRVYGRLYMRRYPLLWIGERGRFFRVQLHVFKAPDPGRDLHNHPFRWCGSLILLGSYVECWCSPRTGGRRRSNRRRWVNWIGGPEKFHRVELDRAARRLPVTLFFAGPSVVDHHWGYLVNGRVVHHTEYERLTRYKE